MSMPPKRNREPFSCSWLPERVMKGDDVAALPQTLFTPPPPHVWGDVQVPQFNVPPQPSASVPQFALWAAQLVGVHPADVVTATSSIQTSPVTWPTS
jgi:hypothetical protein